MSDLPRMSRPVILVLVLAVLAAAALPGVGVLSGRAAAEPASAGPPPQLTLAASAKELALTIGLAVGLIGTYGRLAVPSDLLAWQIATGAMAAPREGVVAWAGRMGWVAASPGQYFISGAGFPDLLLFSAETLRSGTDGVRAIGWFGNDWSLGKGDIVWNDGRSPNSISPVKKPKIDAPEPEF